MQDKQNLLTIGAVVLVVVGLGVFLYRQSQQPTEEVAVVDQEEVARDRAEQFLQNLDVEIPEDATRVNLRDVAGTEGAGIATRRPQGDVLLQSLLVALPDPQPGEFYEAYLLSSDETQDPMYLGKMRMVKGGWALDYQLDSQEAQDYSKIQVTREKTDDRQLEEVVLEAEFPQEVEE